MRPQSFIARPALSPCHGHRRPAPRLLARLIKGVETDHNQNGRLQPASLALLVPGTPVPDTILPLSPLRLRSLCCTRYGNLKLGAQNEVPRFNDLTWFCMLFCCGIAVGFFLFGAGEPLYYYRQPTVWKSWTYDYNLRKIQVNDDAQRANQSIFICFFHWGVHGWIPYILMAINVGVVSHKWGLPLTIRACFYPLIGDTVYSFVGDLIDSISMGKRSSPQPDLFPRGRARAELGFVNFWVS